MPDELVLLVLSISLALFIVYAIVQPKTTKRQVRELIEQACQRWKSGRPLRAKTPHDCAVCCSQAEASPAEGPEPVPYRTIKSRRGRPKTLDSAGYACLNPSCAYFLERDAHKHALISGGKRGAEPAIQQIDPDGCVDENHRFAFPRRAALWRRLSGWSPRICGKSPCQRP